MCVKFWDWEFWENLAPDFPYILGTIWGNEDSCTEEILRKLKENLKICDFKNTWEEIFPIFWK